jgi:hypothetical protein
VTLVRSYIDILRLGNSFNRGGWETGRDALRVVNLAGVPGMAIGRVSRVLAVSQRDGTMMCSWISAVNGLRRTGNRFFIRLFSSRPSNPVSELMTEAGVPHIPDMLHLPGAMVTATNSTIGAGGGIWRSGMNVIADTLRRMSIPVSDFTPVTSELSQLVTWANANRRGVFSFFMDFTRNGRPLGHIILAEYSGVSGIQFIDTNGAIFTSIQGLQSAYTGARLAEATVYFIPRSATIVAAEAAALGSAAAQSSQAIVSVVREVVPVFFESADSGRPPDGERMPLRR